MLNHVKHNRNKTTDRSITPRQRNSRREHDETFRESLAAPISPNVLRNQHDVAFPIARILNVIFAALVALLALRFIFLLLGATPASDIASTIYALSEPFVAPFYGIFGNMDVAGAASVFDGATLVAVAVYALIGWALVRMIDAGSKPVER